MLFTELGKIDEKSIAEALQQAAAARGLAPEVLEEELEGKVTLQALATDVLETLIARAAEANREEFRARQRIGMELAAEQGKTIGRPSVRSDERFIEVRDLYRAHEVSGKEAAAMLNVSRGTFYRWLKEDSGNGENEEA